MIKQHTRTHKLFLVLSLCAAAQQARAATTSKVRLAASFGVQAIKATASAAKAHPFLSLASASTAAAALYVKHEHGKFRRAAHNAVKNHDADHASKMAKIKKEFEPRIKELEAKLDRYKQELAEVERKMRTGNNGQPLTDLFDEQYRIKTLIDEIEKYVPEIRPEFSHATGSLPELKAEMTRRCMKAIKENAEEHRIKETQNTANRVDKLTFKEFLRRLLQDPSRYLTFNQQIGLLLLMEIPFICTICLPIGPIVNSIGFGVCKLFGHPYIVKKADWANYFALWRPQTTTLNNWQEAKAWIKQDFKNDLQFSSQAIPASCAVFAAVLVKLWLQAREREAALQ
jgi:hypothetical protein